MEPELSLILWAKMVAKNIVLGSPGEHFMHMRVNNVLVTAWTNLRIFPKQEFFQKSPIHVSGIEILSFST